VAEICRRLDGLPLAIELAAARVKLFSPRQVLERLDGRLALLVGGPRDLPARQQTLRNLLDWSYALLTPREQRLFAHLGVFAGSWDLDGAAVVHGVENARETGEVAGSEEVEALADAGLLEYVAEGPTAPRFRMLETIREYALARLAESGEADAVRRAHAGYYVALAERAEPELIGPDQVAWTRRLDAEQGNVRAALDWLMRDDAPGAPRLAGALGHYWMRGRSLVEGRRWLEAALERADSPAVRPNLERDLDGLKAQLGKQTFVAASAEGRRLTLDAALRDGLERRPADDRRATIATAWGSMACARQC